MTFLNPAVLLGLIAAGIPILLHLFNLRKLQTIDFSTLAFLKELQKTRIRKLKITQLILLLLRVLIVVCAVLAFARPAIPTSFPGLGARAKSSVVIVLDNSFSMELADERGVRLKQAKEAALTVLRSLGEGDEVALVQMADLDDRRFFEFTRDFSLLKEELQKMPVSYTTAKLESSLRLASSILSASKNINREVFVITDAQKNILREETSPALDSLKLFNPSTALYVIPIGATSKSGERNLAVDSLRVLTRIFEPNKIVEAEARVRNSGQEPVQGVIVSMLFNGERVAQRTVDIPASETRTIPIAAAAPERTGNGVVRAVVEIEGDVLDADNHRHFGFALPPKPRIAVVGAVSETMFLSVALDPAAKALGTPPANITQLPLEALSAANLNDFDAVFIADVPHLTGSDVTRLQAFVQQGGGLLIFAGAQTDITSFNSLVLPAFKLGQIAAKDYSADKPAEFTTADKAHPLFAGVFKSKQDAGTPAQSNTIGVESPRIVKALPLVREASGGYSAQPIVEIADGAWLAESKFGSGKVLYCAVPPTPEWSNFPVTGLFVTLVNRAAAYLTTTVSAGTDAIVGQSVTIPLSGKLPTGATLKITDPNNTESLRQPVQMPSGAALSLEPLRQPGVYVIETQQGSAKQGSVVQTLSVNPPSSESAITLLSPDELTKELARHVARPEQIRIVEDYRRFNADTLRAGAGTELWKFFLLLAVVAAIAEMLVARKAASVQAEG